MFSKSVVETLGEVTRTTHAHVPTTCQTVVASEFTKRTGRWASKFRKWYDIECTFQFGK